MPTYTFKDNNTGLEFDEFWDDYLNSEDKL